MGFSCRELNHIYPINQAYNTKAIINDSSIEDLSVQTKKYSETRTDEQCFTQDNVEIKSYFSVGCSYTSSNDKAPLTFNSYLFFEFQETEDYLFLFKLCDTAYNFLRFLCCRNNISFLKMGNITGQKMELSKRIGWKNSVYFSYIRNNTDTFGGDIK